MSVIHLGTDGHIYTGDRGGCLIAEVAHGIGDESFKGEWGRRIVRAVNCFDELVTACRAALAYVPGSEVHNWPPGFKLKDDAISALRSALKKAEAP